MTEGGPFDAGFPAGPGARRGAGLRRGWLQAWQQLWQRQQRHLRYSSSLGPHLWLSTSAQSAGLLCQRDDRARIVVLGVATRAACTPAQVIDSLAFSAKALGVLSQDDP